MTKWRLDFVMRSGERISAILECNKKDPYVVADAVVSGDPNQFVSMQTIYGSGTLCVKKGEIAAVTVDVLKEF